MSPKKRELNLESFDTVIRIIVGPERQQFEIHKALLCSASTFFHVALNGHFKEANEQKIEMPEDDIETFKHFQYWLYSKKIRMTNDSKHDIKWETLVGLFIFGEARGIPDLQNAAIDGILDKQTTTRWTPLDQIRRIYDNTPPNSALRRLFVDMTHSLSSPGNDTWFSDKTYEYFNQAFLFDLAKAYCRRVNGQGSQIKDFVKIRQHYHVSSSSLDDPPSYETLK